MNDPIPTLAADLIATILGADAATLPHERREQVEAKLREAIEDAICEDWRRANPDAPRDEWMRTPDGGLACPMCAGTPVAGHKASCSLAPHVPSGTVAILTGEVFRDRCWATR